MLLALVLLPIAFASESTPRRPQILVANCGTKSTGLTANITRVDPGSSGTIMFSCGTAGDAITVGGNGRAVPVFTLPPGYTSLRISSEPGCASAFTLVSGSVLKLGKGN